MQTSQVPLADGHALRHDQPLIATARRMMQRMTTIDAHIENRGGWPLTGSTTDPFLNSRPTRQLTPTTFPP